MSVILKLLFGDPNKKLLKSFQPIIDSINSLEGEIQALDDTQLQAKTDEFKARLKKGETLDDLLPEAFAVVREASKRVLNMRHFDVQLIGGIVLHRGQISEMKTGEGKTLVSTLPAYLNALEEKGVYVVTVNDYLAKRDSEWMGQIFRFLGLSVGLIQANMDNDDRRQAYSADITYGTNNEYGFDYLRDNLAWDMTQVCQMRRHFAIIDEVDSILIDEARTPLIISGPVKDNTSKFLKVVKVAKRLERETHFTMDEKTKNVILTEEGNEFIESEMGLSEMYSIENMEVAHMAINCLKAMHLFKNEVDYVVKDGEVQIVDEFTGRILEGRRYSDGLHQAIEAVEGLKIREESQTLASITYQNYFRMFPKLAGMTGTAETEAAEFEKIYGLSVVVIPTNKPLSRDDKADVVYKNKVQKYNAIIRDVTEIHKKGQPVLVGTISIETSEHLSALLKQRGIVHNVLNAKYHEREAEIISRAGQKGAVTIATNMAGRGTDIVLGEGVKELGGLCVIGTERHESRRIDNQLRGRSGRQGDPGASRFYVALDDDLMRMFGSDRIASIMDRLGFEDDTPIEHGMISKSIERAQKKVEQYHFGIRKQILEYDDVMNRQRTTIYALRQQILEGRKLQEKLHDMAHDLITAILGDVRPASEKNLSQEHREEFIGRVQKLLSIQNLEDALKDMRDTDELVERLVKVFDDYYRFRCSEVPDGVFEELVTRRVLLSTLDRKWMDHLHNMDVLREGIGLRAFGQRDPLIEYKREAFDMFSELIFSINEESLSLICRTVLVEKDETPDAEELSIVDVEHANYSQAKEPPNLLGAKEAHHMEASEPAKSDKKVGRNDPCPCGSGQKYKKCHGANQ